MRFRNSEPTEKKTDTEEPVVEEPVVTQTISAGDVQADGVTTVYELTGSETMNFRIEVSGDTWIGIRNANGKSKSPDRVYKAGEVSSI